ncbi:hypothetical protein F4804DRAFT_352520 [Jackrogersella minutella]|nr:hypothetical protein F4804DRAFT_352520 [Jackrogersella minutella]
MADQKHNFPLYNSAKRRRDNHEDEEISQDDAYNYFVDAIKRVCFVHSRPNDAQATQQSTHQTRARTLERQEEIQRAQRRAQQSQEQAQQTFRSITLLQVIEEESDHEVSTSPIRHQEYARLEHDISSDTSTISSTISSIDSNIPIEARGYDYYTTSTNTMSSINTLDFKVASKSFLRSRESYLRAWDRQVSLERMLQDNRDDRDTSQSVDEGVRPESPDHRHFQTLNWVQGSSNPYEDEPVSPRTII